MEDKGKNEWPDEDYPGGMIGYINDKITYIKKERHKKQGKIFDSLEKPKNPEPAASPAEGTNVEQEASKSLEQAASLPPPQIVRQVDPVVNVKYSYVSPMKDQSVRPKVQPRTIIFQLPETPYRSPGSYPMQYGGMGSVVPVQNVIPKNYKTYRYTIPEEFLDHWTKKSLMHPSLLSYLKSQWSADDWDGLYQPPDWLVPKMFLIALEGIASNSEKRAKLARAQKNLEMAKLVQIYEAGEWEDEFEKPMVTVPEEILDSFSAAQNELGLRLVFLASRVSKTTEKLKFECYKKGKKFLERAKVFAVETGAVLPTKE